MRRRGGEGAGGPSRRVLRPVRLRWLPPSCWSQDVPLRTEKESEGPLQKTASLGNAKPFFQFPSSLTYWHYYFLFSRLTLPFDPCSDLRSLGPAVTSEQPNYFCLPCSGHLHTHSQVYPPGWNSASITTPQPLMASPSVHGTRD